jgi:hypothetical protein
MAELAVMEEVTFRLPREIMRHVHETAKRRHTPVDLVVAEALQERFSPIRESVERDYEALRSKLQSLESARLETLKKKGLSRAKQSRLEQLLSSNLQRDLTLAEQVEVEALTSEVEQLSATSLLARVILQERYSSLPQ